ncbi:hypothetical protein [Streptomyces sp. NPDC001851]|uniref:hypothetical protein n=1 Tax=Streptomyces sp. NPDC001851 TaxID=3154529 RepID=UPI0033217AFF
MTKEKPHSAVVPSVRDPIRIVPLSVEEEFLRPIEGAPPVTVPHLRYMGGPILSSVKVFTVYWGADWGGNRSLFDTATQLDEFFDFVLSSELIDELSEYSVNGQQIRHGRRIGRAIVTAPRPKTVVSDAAVQHMLQQELVANPDFPVPDANTLYFVYLPPGITVVQGGSRSCQAFCGYHSDIGGQIFYAVMPYPGCPGCLGELGELDALTSTSSHELCEAITDPVPGRGWYDEENGEIGDICAWKTRKVGDFTVQKEWSNKNEGCI